MQMDLLIENQCKAIYPIRKGNLPITELANSQLAMSFVLKISHVLTEIGRLLTG